MERGTRRWRVALVGSVLALPAAFMLALLWAPARVEWFAQGGTGNLGTRIQTYGGFEYLQVVDWPFPTPVPGQAPATTAVRTVEWRWPALAATIAASIGTLVGAFAIHRLTLAVWKLPADRCDECGYDLRGAPAGRCPECGAARERPQAAAPLDPEA